MVAILSWPQCVKALPSQRASNVELLFYFDAILKKLLKKITKLPVIWDIMTLIWRHKMNSFGFSPYASLNA